MRLGLSLAALSAIHAIHAQLEIQHTKTPTTWFSSTYVTEHYISSRTIQYGKTPVTPVPTLTAPLVIERTTLTEPTASRNINHTAWTTLTVTTSLITTEMSIIYASSTLPPPTTTANLTTSYIWTSPILATITFTTTACNSPTGTRQPNPPTKTITKYTGTYTPFPGQITTTHLRTTFPTSVISYNFNTITYRLYPYTGSTVTQTLTRTDTVFLSTTTSTLTLSSYPGKYTSTTYRTTLTSTRSDYQLAYITHTSLHTTCPTLATVTKTYNAKCSPENLISEQEGRGVAVRLLPNEWTFPIGFPGVVIGIPGGGGGNDNGTGYAIPDPSACCQFCLNNKGCAASEWVIGGGLPGRDGGSCRLFYYVGAGVDGTCGRGRDGIGGGGDDVELEYFGDSYKLPGQGSLIQSGCGGLRYLGGMNPFCPSCVVEGVDEGLGG